MKMQRNNKSIFLSLISGFVLTLLVILAVGSAEMHAVFFYNYKYSHQVKPTREHKVTIEFEVTEKDTLVILKEGFQDEHGRWQGKMYWDAFSMKEGRQLAEGSSRCRNGTFHGLTDVSYYKDGKLDRRKKIYYADGWVTSTSKWLSPAGKSAQDDNSAYNFFLENYPVDGMLLYACGYDSIYIKDFLDALEFELYAEEFESSDFNDRYESAVEALEETPFDSVLNDNEALSLLNGFERVKDHPFRLAVIDGYLEQMPHSMDMLESRYSGFVSDLEEADITQTDLSEFCRQFDSCMASYGNLDLENLYLIDSIDAWIYRAIFTLYESGEEDVETGLKGAVDPVLLGMLGLKNFRFQVNSVLLEAIESDDTPEVAEVMLYTIFMSFLEGDVIRQSLWESWIRNSGITVMPEVGTGNLEGLSSSSASLGGYIFYDGGETLLEKGLVWGESYDPTTAMGSQRAEVETDSFNLTIDGLEEGKQYYARAFATNSQGTAYGSTVSFIAGEVSGLDDPGTKNDGLRIFPNPASEVSYLEFRLDSQEEISLTIINLNGQVVYMEELGMKPFGENKVEVDLSYLAEGVYICQLSGKNAVIYNQKLVIAK